MQKKRYGIFNPKRKFRELNPAELQQCKELALQVKYGGNPEHKKNPGDFGLTPPSSPRSAKSLCDNASIFERAVALRHLKSGLKKGLVSEQNRNNWPQNIWAVSEQGEPLEAQLENSETGTYHGYPIPETDPMFYAVLEKWNSPNAKI
jgi:hypothetical protein